MVLSGLVEFLVLKTHLNAKSIKSNIYLADSKYTGNPFALATSTLEKKQNTIIQRSFSLQYKVQRSKEMPQIPGSSGEKATIILHFHMQ